MKMANITPSTQAAGSVPAVEREQERIAFKDAHRHLELYEVPDAWGRPMFKHSHVEASWLGWIARASHGQAPAQPKPATQDAERKHLTDEQIERDRPMMAEPAAYAAGVRYAEKHHGIAEQIIEVNYY